MASATELLELGDRYWALGLPAAARSALGRALAASSDPDPALRLADIALAQGDVRGARAFAAEKIAPFALKWDEEKYFPVETIREAATLGMGGIYIRESSGGSGLTRLDAVLIIEALAAGCPSTASYLSIHNMVAWMISKAGTPAQTKLA